MSWQLAVCDQVHAILCSWFSFSSKTALAEWPSRTALWLVHSGPVHSVSRRPLASQGHVDSLVIWSVLSHLQSRTQGHWEWEHYKAWVLGRNPSLDTGELARFFWEPFALGLHTRTAVLSWSILYRNQPKSSDNGTSLEHWVFYPQWLTEIMALYARNQEIPQWKKENDDNNESYPW